MTDITIVAGTRPEIVKISAVVEELQARGIVPHCLLTGQHQELLEGTPLDRARYVTSIGLKSDGNVTRWLRQAETALARVLRLEKPRVVVVQGDTMSGYAGARCAAYVGVAVAHIEAGVRSHDPREPWPEEMLRTEMDALATWHYAPTQDAADNLADEGIDPRTTLVTGNTGVSALARYTEARPVTQGNGQIIVTLHRRELTRDVARFRPVIDAIMDAARMMPAMRVLWPVHPATAGAVFSDKPANVEFVMPMAYPEFARAVAHASGVLTDSGGLVEECATLGVPCAVLRRVTDRPEAEAVGIAQRFDPAPAGVREALVWLAQGQARTPSDIYGTPLAASRIADHLVGVVLAKATA